MFSTLLFALKDAVVSAEDMARNKTTKELYKMQAEIAMYMEIAYLSASNFPELSGEVTVLFIRLSYPLARKSQSNMQ